jgi:hypothetical protein
MNTTNRRDGSGHAEWTAESPAPQIRLEQRGRGLVAVSDVALPPLSQKAVRELLALVRDRAG